MSRGEFIKGCPFCGSNKVNVCRTNRNACWIECDECGGSSESAKFRILAIGNWNQRSLGAGPVIIVNDLDAEFIR